MTKLIDLITSKNAIEFKAAFEERMAEKVVSAIEQEKILVAQSFFNIEESVNEEFDLHAERSDTFAKKFIKTFKSKDAAAAHVEKMEDNEKWPEGHEAVLTHKKTGEKHIYIDGWEKLGEQYDAVRDELKNRGMRYFGGGRRRY